MTVQKLYHTLEIPGSFLVPSFIVKTSEPGFIGLNDFPDSNTKKSYESVNHKNQSSDNFKIYKSIIQLVNNE